MFMHDLDKAVQRLGKLLADHEDKIGGKVEVRNIEELSDGLNAVLHQDGVEVSIYFDEETLEDAGTDGFILNCVGSAFAEGQDVRDQTRP